VGVFLTEESIRCNKITSENDCNNDNVCSWDSNAKILTETTGQTVEELEKIYDSDFVNKLHCLLNMNGNEELTWRHAICNLDKDSDEKLDINEFNDGASENEKDNGHFDLTGKIFNEVKGSDNKLNRCEYKKFQNKLINKQRRLSKECQDKGMMFNGIKCVTKQD
jgi:hypothetical protein